MKQTAVDFLIDQLSPYICFPLGESAGYNLQGVFDRAKEIHKDEIIDAHIEGQREFDDYPHTQWTNDQAEAYYNETFKVTPLK
jgi:hypothetical protein